MLLKHCIIYDNIKHLNGHKSNYFQKLKENYYLDIRFDFINLEDFNRWVAFICT